MFYFALDNYLRICAKNMYSMLINILMALCNIFLDYLFIVVFGWGLFSAALSTCIGLSLTTILGFLPFVFGNVELKFSKILFRLKTLLNIFYNGSSVFLGNISGSTLTIVANFIVETCWRKWCSDIFYYTLYRRFYHCFYYEPM